MNERATNALLFMVFIGTICSLLIVLMMGWSFFKGKDLTGRIDLMPILQKAVDQAVQEKIGRLMEENPIPVPDVPEIKFEKGRKK